MPFTKQQFFEVFAAYNNALWPVVAAWWVVTVVSVGAAWHTPAAGGWLIRLLALLWIWNGLVYHAWLFSAINPAAWVFAALFVIQAAMLALAGGRRVGPFFSARGWRQSVGLALTVYAFLYPFLTMAAGHAFPATPTFGVPCPTVILTIGLLLTTPAPPPHLTIIPMLWSLIGGSAAHLFSVPTDYALLGAGLLLGAMVIRRPGKPRIRRSVPSAPGTSTGG